MFMLNGQQGRSKLRRPTRNFNLNSDSFHVSGCRGSANTLIFLGFLGYDGSLISLGWGTGLQPSLLFGGGTARKTIVGGHRIVSFRPIRLSVAPQHLSLTKGRYPNVPRVRGTTLACPGSRNFDG